MGMRIFSLRNSLGVLALMGAATGCFLKQSDDVGSSGDEVVSGAEATLLLKSTLVLDAGCLATKVGPRQLLLSARCVSENKAAFTKGKVLGYTTANNAGARENVLAPAGADSGSRDSGTTTTSTDAGGQGD